MSGNPRGSGDRYGKAGLMPLTLHTSARYFDLRGPSIAKEARCRLVLTLILLEQCMGLGRPDDEHGHL
jgi:hypothetical protein